MIELAYLGACGTGVYFAWAARNCFLAWLSRTPTDTETRAQLERLDARVKQLEAKRLGDALQSAKGRR